MDDDYMSLTDMAKYKNPDEKFIVIVINIGGQSRI